MIEFVEQGYFLECFKTGFIVGAGIALSIMGIRAVIRIAMRLLRKA